ncbi:MAG: Crp/Fnr family transcriptional regulator [Saprospiraceae bacterium]|nr:Crp/Fnr family transcriptional regulator [Saprospiraceae bacterium]
MQPTNHMFKNDYSILDYALSSSTQHELRSFFQIIKIQKKESLLIAGETCRNIYFVKKGAVKEYYMSDNKEFIQNFYFEGSMACQFNSFLSQTASDSYLEALEGSEIWILSYEDFQIISKTNSELNQHLSFCMAKNNANRVNLLMVNDSMMRYEKFLEEEPDVQQRVPQYMIASYLGMTPETLSRLRKKMSIRNKAA